MEILTKYMFLQQVDMDLFRKMFINKKYAKMPKIKAYKYIP